MNVQKHVLVSVVVACRNEIRHIQRFLNSLVRQDLWGIPTEVIIADGMSDDGTRSVLDNFQPNVFRLRIIDNPGRSASSGLNCAIRHATGDVIIRMDAHTEYAFEYVRRCVQVLLQTNADNVGGPVRTRAEGYLAKAIALAYQSRFASGGAKTRDTSFEGPVSGVTYGCWRKSTLQRVGCFDETLYRCQDDELNRRILAGGGTIWQSPRIVSWYYPRASLASLFHQYFQYGFWKARVTRKHRQLAFRRHAIPAICAGLFLLLMFGAGIATICGLHRGQRYLLSAIALVCGGYVLAAIAAASLVARKAGWRYVAVLPGVFALQHVPYGFGFLLGMVCDPTKSARSSLLHDHLTVVTR